MLTFGTREFLPYPGSAAFRRNDPFAVGLGKVLADVVGVTADQVTDPVPFGVVMEGDDLAGRPGE